MVMTFAGPRPCRSRTPRPEKRRAAPIACGIAWGETFRINSKAHVKLQRTRSVPRAIASAGQRLLHREEIAPREALLQRAAQQEGRMERRHGADFALARVEAEPTPA